MSEPTTLYRMVDDRGDLLYIGIASNVGRRMDQHSDDKVWWTDAAVVVLEHFPTRGEAEWAEREAIRTEGPLHNKALRGPSQRRARSVDRFLVEKLQDAFGIQIRIPRLYGRTTPPPLTPCRLCGKLRERKAGVRNRAGLCPTCFDSENVHHA